MAKWKSALFSDIRNKLGNQVTFSSWKGRGYMRAYVIPSNPKTLGQTAHRAAMAKSVALGQGIFATEANKTEWNRVALSALISGFNLFTKDSIGSPIIADDYSAAAVTKFTGTRLSIPRGDLVLIVDKSGTKTVHTPSAVGGSAPAYEIAIADLSPAYTPADGDTIFLGDNRVFPDTAVAAEIAAKATSNYAADAATGTAVQAILTA